MLSLFKISMFFVDIVLWSDEEQRKVDDGRGIKLQTCTSEKENYFILF